MGDFLNSTRESHDQGWSGAFVAELAGRGLHVAGSGEEVRYGRQGGTALSKSGTVPPPRGPRSWRTRPDVFADVWPQVQVRLEADPQLQAVTLFRELVREHPERFQECHRRTFERCVNQWRATTGLALPVFFD